MGILDTYQEENEKVMEFIQGLPLEPPKPPIEKYPSEIVVVAGFLLVGYIVFRQLQHRIRTPINRISSLILVPSYFLSSIYIAHEMGTCGPFRCRPAFWAELSQYLSYDDYSLIMATTVVSFIFAFFFDETVLKLLRWIKHG